MKRQTKLKAFALSVAMAFGMLLPNAAFAQSDDFFRTEDNFGGNRDFSTTEAIQNNGIGQSEAPLGSGLLILTAVGAGYAVARRRRSPKSHKKSVTLLLALAMTLTFTNCKKKVDTIQSVEPEGVHITLNVGDDNSKVVVTPGFYNTETGETYAKVDFEDGDILYVGNNGAYCGYLTYDKSTSKFGGNITPTSANDGDYLHFYFMGNKGPVGSAPSSVYITDQTSKYPVISYGRSTSLYNSGTSSYSATLYNKCAIGKFTISGVDTDKAITITGMNNTVAVDFSKNGTGDVVNPYTYSKTGSGEIRLHAESNTVRWAILLPQDEVTTATAYAAGYTTTSAFTVPEVSANGYYDSDVAVAMASVSPKGAFTINDSGGQVFFAPGNLQYKAGKGWRFAENQYDICQTSTGTWSTSDWVDLFGWGTWGSGKNPLNTSTNNEDYQWSTDFQGTLGDYSTWRTLTMDEWKHIFNSRQTGVTVNGTANARYTEATINTGGTEVNGMILFPDSYSGPTTSTDGITFGTINAVSSWGTTCTTKESWETLESAGCVFLPAAGSRKGTSVNNVGVRGCYWSRTSDTDADRARSTFFSSSDVTHRNHANRSNGYQVRLARVVE